MVAALAVVGTVVLVMWDAESGDPSRTFVSTSRFTLWLLLLGGQAAVWVGAAPFVVATTARRWRDLSQRGALDAASILAIGAAVVSLPLLIAFMLVAPRLGLFESVASSQVPNGPQWPLAAHERKMFVILGASLLIGLAAIAGMWVTTAGFVHLERRPRPRASSVERFLALRSEVTVLLAVAGTLIGFATLSSGALREAVLAEEVQALYRERTVSCLLPHLAAEGLRGDAARRLVRTDLDSLMETYPECRQLVFDARYVIAYRVLFTGILALAFAPTFVAMRRAAERIRDRTFPLPHPNSPAFEGVVARRASFDALLQTNLSATATFKAGVAIAIPLVASLVSTALPI